MISGKKTKSPKIWTNWCREWKRKKWLTEKVDWRRRAGRDKEWRLAGWLNDQRATHTAWRHIPRIDDQCDGSLSLKFLMLSIWTFWLNNFGHFHLSSWHNHRLLALYQISVSLKVFEIYTLSLKKAKLGDNLPDHFYYWGQMKAVVRGLSWWSARGRGGSNQARISAHSPTHPPLANTLAHMYCHFLFHPGVPSLPDVQSSQSDFCLVIR